MKYTCRTKCFFRSRLWTPGETLESKADEKIPHHFTTEAVALPVKEPVKPVAMSQMHAKEARPVQKAKASND